VSKEWAAARPSAETQRRASRASLASRKLKLRGMDPVTTEIDYSDAELEFLKAVEEYKKRYDRRFPTLHELLQVLKSLGYAKPQTQASAAS